MKVFHRTDEMAKTKKRMRVFWRFLAFFGVFWSLTFCHVEKLIMDGSIVVPIGLRCELSIEQVAVRRIADEAQGAVGIAERNGFRFQLSSFHLGRCLSRACLGKRSCFDHGPLGK